MLVPNLQSAKHIQPILSPNSCLILLLITKMLHIAFFFLTNPACNLDSILLSFIKLSLEAKIRGEKIVSLHVVKELQYLRVV